MNERDTLFSGAVPEIYERYLVPLIFQTYAKDLVERLRMRRMSNVLEIAAGTGVVTRALASTLDKSVSIVATDLNQAMLDKASAIGTARPVIWQQADAMRLPFPDSSFDAVVCQFGAMFFPDKASAFSEARRVLKPGGVFLFNVWDRIDVNEFADTVLRAMAALFPDDPPRFMTRTPHGYHDLQVIAQDLVAGGFTNAPRMETVTARSVAASPRIAAIAYCQGTPLRNEIEARGADRIEEATEVAERAIAQRFGTGRVDGRIQAHVIAVER